jgi:uncharacterized protein YuzE
MTGSRWRLRKRRWIWPWQSSGAFIHSSRSKQAMRQNIDRANDALYFRLVETEIFESEEVQPGVILDFDESGHIVGVEMLALSTRTDPEKLSVLQLETA